MIAALLGHDRLETTARYNRVAIGMIAGIESPLDALSKPRPGLRGETRRSHQRHSRRPWLDQISRSRISSAITVPAGVRPTAGM